MLEPAVALILLFLASALCSWVTTGIVRGAAVRIGLVDRPDERKIHERATPRLGGLAIIFGFGFPLLLTAATKENAALVAENFASLFAVLASASLVIGLGVYDDLVGANAPKKFAIQTTAAVILVAFGFRFTEVSIAGGLFDLGVFGYAISALWIVGVINALNFIDGLDSLATVVSITIAVCFAIISIIRRDAFSLVIMTSLAGSLIGFFPWNKPPARIFMGDTGSMFIGLILAAISIAKPSKSPAALVVGGPMLALALPVIDTLIVMKQRFRGEPLPLPKRITRMFNADKQHIHHILVEKYGSTIRAITSIWMITLLFGGAAIMTAVQELKIFGYTIGAIGLALLLLLRYRHKPVAPDTSGPA